MSYGNGLMHIGYARPHLPPSHRRNGELLLLLPSRVGERSRRVRERQHQRLRRISPAAADPVRGRCTDQRSGGTPAAGAAADERRRSPMPRLMSDIYAGPGGAFEVRPGNPLAIVANGRSARFSRWGGEHFPHDPPGFRAIQPDVRAQGRRRSPAQAGVATSYSQAELGCASPVRPGASEARRPLRQRRSVGGQLPMSCERGGKLVDRDGGRRWSGVGEATCGASARRAGRPSARASPISSDGRPQTLHLLRREVPPAPKHLGLRRWGG